MKNIILFTLFFLSFSHFIHAQVVEKYIDSNDASTTVIEKVPESDYQDILSTLNLDDYGLNEEIYIIDHRQLQVENKEEEEVEEEENEEETPVIAEQTVQERIVPNDTANQIRPESPERNPIGEKIRRKKKRTPRWKSDRRGKRSSSTCFKF